MSTFAIKKQAADRSAAWQLALDKFPFQGGSATSLPEKKIDVLKRATDSSRTSDSWNAAIRSKVRWLDCLATQHGSNLRLVTLVNSSRLLLHLGRSSVLENVGLHCDRTTGLPVIPGSAVKGVLSTWACWAEHFDEVTGEFREFTRDSIHRRRFTSEETKHAARIFGDDSSTGSTEAGEVTFLGAFPVKPPVLELDIVTPHTDPQGKDRNPVPNPFLAIAAGTEWKFAFLAKPRGGSDSAPLLDQAASWLVECLEQSGIGAKTAAGYGRFLTPARWNELTLDETARQAQRIQQEKDKAKADTLATIRASAIGDYANEATFNNLVINRLNKPGEYQQLQTEVKKIESNPANAPWIERITDALRDNKDARKRLRDKDWFPKTWLPQ
jgi:CRISPR type III-B/RAMP module RAMP protein Cmr6